MRGMSEADAKMEYVKRCRGLKTYGVTFFLVKVSKIAHLNKTVPKVISH
jgi:talin